MPTPDDLIYNSFMTDTAQNPDEQSQNEKDDLHEGDIANTEASNRLLRSGLRGGQWDYHIIPYKINWNAVKKAYRPWVQEKLDYVLNFEYKYKLGDCITLCEKDKECSKLGKNYNQRSYIDFKFEKGGCWSSVGMNGGRQPLNLQFPSCLAVKGTMAHEIMHALGFYHEQSRPDRDSYVYVAMSNVKGERTRNFEKQSETIPYDHYDFNSVMHYGEFAFRNKEYGGLMAQLTRTIYPNLFSWGAIKMQMSNWGRGVTLGQRVGLSFCDELKLRRFYSEPGIIGGKTCTLWTPRTCQCKDHAGNEPLGFDKDKCAAFGL